MPPSVEQARVAAQARDRFPLNMGDCFASALTCDRDLPLLAVDRDFGAVDVPVELP